jgi:hypothetical protein
MSEELEGVQPRFNDEEDRLYTDEVEQEIFDRMEELALAGELDDDSYRALLSDYGLTEDDFTPPTNVGGLYDDGYDLGRTDPPPDDSGSFDDSDDFLNASNPNVSDREGANPGGIFEGNSGGEDGGGSGGGGSIYDVSDTTTTNTTPGGSGGGGMMEFPAGSGVYIPEGMLEQAKNLINQGVGIRNLANALGLESRNQQDIEGPVNVSETDNTTSTNTDMTDAELNGLEDDPNFTGEFEGQQYENGTLVSSDVSGDLSSSSATGGNASASGGEGGDSSSSSNVGDIDAGDASASVGNIDAGGTGGAGGFGGAGGSGGTGGGGTGGNVTVNFGDGSGGSNAGYEKFFEMINSYIASGEPIEEGDVKGIYEQFIETSPQSADAIRSFLALDRPVSEDQAQLKTDIYGNVIESIREAQSPLMKSLTRRSEMQGAEAERLMGPLSFLEDRDATQAGYGQAVSGGRGLGNISGMLAGRERAEQKNVNLQLAGNLLGQQRATAGLMADVESGIYSQMAPDIGLDFGSLLGISGVDVQNILGERQSTRAAKAAERGANIKLGIEAVPTVLGGIKTGYDWITSLGK